MLVHLIHKEHKIFRRTITGSRCIVTNYLIAPGSIQRVLHNRHQFNVCIAHFLHIGNDLRCQFSVIYIRSILASCKGTEIYFVNRHCFLFRFEILSICQPVFIRPFKLGKICHNRSSVWAELRLISVRICL